MININKLKESWFFKEKTINKWDFLFKQWDIDENLYIIIDWELEITKDIPNTDSKENILAYLQNNDIFWEASLNNDFKKDVNIKATKNTILIFINATKWLDDFAVKHHNEAFNLLKEIISLSNNRLRISNKIITASYNISNEIVKLETFSLKEIFKLIERTKEVTEISEIMYFEESPVSKDYAILKYKTSERNKLQDKIIKVSNDQLELTNLKILEKYFFTQKLKIGNKNYWYLIFIKEMNNFIKDETKLFWSISTSLAWVLKQKQLYEEQKNKDYMKN